MNGRIFGPLLLFLGGALAGCGGTRHELTTATPADSRKQVSPWIRAEGFAPITGTNDLVARESAIAAAQRAVVEQVVGVLVSGQTLVRQSMLVGERILTRSAGFVEQTKVVEEGRKDGLYRVLIQARVRTARVQNTMEEAGIILRTARVGRPRIVIYAHEGFPTGLRPTAVSALEESLTKTDYKVMTHVGRQVSLHELRTLFDDAPSTEAVRAIGEAVGAELLFLVRGEVLKGGTAGMADLVSVKVSVSGRVLRTGTGEIISSEESQATRMNVSEDAASRLAVRAAALALGQRLAVVTAERLYQTPSVDVTVIGLSGASELGKVQAALRDIELVSVTYLRDFSESEATIEVELRNGTADLLAQRLAAQFPGRLVVSGVKGSRVLMERKEAL